MSIVTFQRVIDSKFYPVFFFFNSFVILISIIFSWDYDFDDKALLCHVVISAAVVKHDYTEGMCAAHWWPHCPNCSICWCVTILFSLVFAEFSKLMLSEWSFFSTTTNHNLPWRHLPSPPSILLPKPHTLHAHTSTVLGWSMQLLPPSSSSSCSSSFSASASSSVHHPPVLSLVSASWWFYIYTKKITLALAGRQAGRRSRSCNGEWASRQAGGQAGRQAGECGSSKCLNGRGWHIGRDLGDKETTTTSTVVMFVVSLHHCVLWRDPLVIYLFIFLLLTSSTLYFLILPTSLANPLLAPFFTFFSFLIEFVSRFAVCWVLF